VLELPGLWETNDAVVNSIVEIVRFDLDDEYFNNYADRVRELSLEQVAQAANDVIRPDSLVWVVVGDREKVEPGIRELGLGEIQILDADGNPVEGGGTPSAHEGT